jgi:hypothetical protein
MAQFDSTVIEQFAEALYRRAGTIVAFYAIVAALLGGGLGAVVGNATGVGVGPGGLVFLVLGALIGAAAGREKAFALKLQAQTALCQVAIERNTRRS